MSKINVGVIGAPKFKRSALYLAMAKAIATCSFEPVEAEEYDWLEHEPHALLREFDRLQVSTWDEYTIFTVDHEQADGLEIFAVTANGCPFSFRKLDDRHTITYSGECVEIKPETYQYFANSCLELKEILGDAKNI